MEIEEIIAAVDAGKVVNWLSPKYQVVKSSSGKYVIEFEDEGVVKRLALTHAAGTRLGGHPSEYWIADSVPAEPGGPVSAAVGPAVPEALSEPRALLKLVDAAWRVFTDSGDWQARSALGASLAGMPTRTEIAELLSHTAAQPPIPSRLYRAGANPVPQAVVTIPANLDRGSSAA